MRAMAPTVRPAHLDELDPIEAVMREAYAVLGSRDYDAQQISSAMKHVAYLDRQLLEDGTYFVVEHEGEVVGGGGWSRRRKLFNGPAGAVNDFESLDPRADPARIRAMFVKPGWERKGIGRMVLQTCEEAARAAGFLRVELLATLTGLPLYAASGYRTIAPHTFEMPDGVRMDGAIMGKQL
jgi:GNAT superfamily N-acetyltransferase